jgi:hypothetical protein
VFYIGVDRRTPQGGIEKNLGGLIALRPASLRIQLPVHRLRHFEQITLGQIAR